MLFRIQRSPRSVNAHRKSSAPHARHRVSCEASGLLRSAGLYAKRRTLAKRRTVREFHVEVDGLASKPRLWNICQRIAPLRIIVEARFPRPTCSATCQPQPRRSKIDNSQPFQRPQTQIGGLPFQNRAIAAMLTSKGARNPKARQHGKAPRDHEATRKRALSGERHRQNPKLAKAASEKAGKNVAS